MALKVIAREVTSYEWQGDTPMKVSNIKPVAQYFLMVSLFTMPFARQIARTIYLKVTVLALVKRL